MQPSAARPIAIAIQALGGQGGGVLVDWIVDMAEAAGWIAQATSVAGVAQRTGTTIYYLELLPPQARRDDGALPVLAQMPVPGEVDILIAAELMEAGRAVQRGLVTPDRTAVIASSHRAYSVQEKSVPGNGIADAAEVIAAVRAQAKRFIHDDLQALAVRHGSVISASLFGALAGSGALPFAQEAFEATVQRSGVGVEASLVALRAAAELAREPLRADSAPSDAMQTAPRALPESAFSPAVQPLLDRIRSGFPQPTWAMLGEGLQRVIEYQDLRYGDEYLDRMAAVLAADVAAGGAGRGHALTVETARWLAVAMAYDDIIRVADLKTRAERFERVRREVGADEGEVVGVEEYFRPRLDELCAALPRRLGARIIASPGLSGWLTRRLDRGWRVQSDRVWGHAQLRLVAGLRRWRRGSLRHAKEIEHIEAWLRAVKDALAHDYSLAVEVVVCRRVVKGYSDTHGRGISHFDCLMRAAGLLSAGPAAAQGLATLREAALRDATGQALDDRWRSLGLPAP